LITDLITHGRFCFDDQMFQTQRSEIAVAKFSVIVSGTPSNP
jgi:hypothetical protein